MSETETEVKEEQEEQTGILEITEEQLGEILAIAQSPDVIVPIRVPREDVSKIKAVKVSELEKERIANFQLYLFKLGYLTEDSFSSLFAYVFNLAFTLHRQAAEREARKEKAGG